MFGWWVDFSYLDIEVFLYIVDNSVVIGIVLIKESRGKWNIVYFGLMNLKLLIVYCMFLLVNIRLGREYFFINYFWFF